MTQTPRVSIGIPVYNGQNYLAAALDCWLAQSFTDFEIILSDNASTDHTADICRHYAERDSRIRYQWLEQNIGLTPNFNRVVGQARGEFFTWAAHDDLRSPDYLQRCVQVLDRDAELLACHGQTALIDKFGQIQSPAQPVALRSVQLTSAESHTRLAGVLLHTTLCHEVYGLIRTAELRKTALLQSFFGSDMVLLAELGLRGKIRVLPETLFFSRTHAEQAVHFSGTPERTAPATPVARPFALPRKVRYPLALLSLLWNAPLTAGERLLALGVLARFGMQWQKWRGVVQDLRHWFAAPSQVRSHKVPISLLKKGTGTSSQSLSQHCF